MITKLGASAGNGSHPVVILVQYRPL